MANSIWTTEEFTCAGCSMNYTATREEHSEAHSGSFKSESAAAWCTHGPASITSSAGKP